MPDQEFLTNAVDLAHMLCCRIVLPGDRVLDATMGNGHDTALLCKLVGQNGLVYAFDVQEAAVVATEKRLQSQNLLKQARLILDNHQHIHRYISEPLKLAIFNLGYLPGTDHRITTEKDTVLAALEQCLMLLQQGGMLLIVVYPGHPSGKEELEALEFFMRTLDQRLYTAARFNFMNQRNEPPQLFCIEKRIIKNK